MTDGHGRHGAERYTYHLDPSESLSQGVVAALAAVTGAPPVTADPTDGGSSPPLVPLYDVIDPDALDAVFRSTTGRARSPTGRVTFSYCGHVVTARGDGTVEVERREGELEDRESADQGAPELSGNDGGSDGR